MFKNHAIKTYNVAYLFLKFNLLLLGTRHRRALAVTLTYYDPAGALLSLRKSLSFINTRLPIANKTNNKPDILKTG